MNALLAKYRALPRRDRNAVRVAAVVLVVIVVAILL